MTRKELLIRARAVETAFCKEDIEKAVDDAMLLVRTMRGNNLYRFRPPKMHEIDALRENKIYLCRPSVYEDQNDCKILYDTSDLFKHFMLKIKPERYQAFYNRCGDTIMQKMVNDLECHPEFQAHADKIRNQCLIACITQNYSNFMWENYAQDGQGVCFEYDIYSVVEGLKKCLTDLKFFPVRYVEDREKVIDIRFDSGDLDDSEDSIHKASLKYILSCMTKDKIPYAKEAEWRILCEYGELDGEEKGKLFDFIPPSRIILGPQISLNRKFQAEISKCAADMNIQVCNS